VSQENVEDGGQTAILVIDMVEDMFTPHEALARQRGAMVTAINTLTDAGRRSGFPVVWVRQEYMPDLSDAPLEYRRRGIKSTITGTPGAALLAELEIAPEDHSIIKKRYSAFFGTSLDGYLGERQVGRLVLAGVNTHACIRTTAVDAYQRDYDVTLVTDCIGSHDQVHHEVSLRYMDGKIGRALSLRALLDGLP
jgi:maleamate amidohydrolase